MPALGAAVVAVELVAYLLEQQELGGRLVELVELPVQVGMVVLVAEVGFAALQQRRLLVGLLQPVPGDVVVELVVVAAAVVLVELAASAFVDSFVLCCFLLERSLVA